MNVTICDFFIRSSPEVFLGAFTFGIDFFA